jgi:thiamine-monophosphate kinase
VPKNLREKIDKISTELQLPITRIGNIHEGAGLVVLDANEQKITIDKTGYDHFT